MKKSRLFISSGPAILMSTTMLVIYIFLLQSDFTFKAALLVFAISPVVMVYMVFCILKDRPEKPERTFREYFYMDMDYRRNMVS